MTNYQVKLTEKDMQKSRMIAKKEVFFDTLEEIKEYIEEKTDLEVTVLLWDWTKVVDDLDNDYFDPAIRIVNRKAGDICEFSQQNIQEMLQKKSYNTSEKLARRLIQICK